jgi:outer membrane protein OmpA-like peptidoglycan-associated protein
MAIPASRDGKDRVVANRNQAMRGKLAVVGLAVALTGCAQMSSLGSRAQISTTPRCTDFLFSVYFADRSADLTGPAKAVVHNAGRHAAGCPVAGVDVTGLADYPGPAESNLELSRQRAQHVAEALVGAGLPAPSFKINAVGESGALTPEGAKPLRRRADIYIRFAR